MWRALGLSRLSIATIVPFVLLGNSQEQSPSQPDATQVGVVLSKLSAPEYPPMAQAARVAGDVELKLEIRQDGSIGSAAVVSGPPMLRQAAVDSAKRSQFECRSCVQAVTPFSLKYSYQIVPRDAPEDCNGIQAVPNPPAKVDILRHEVKVFAWEKWKCDPEVTSVPVRSVKCLYLWRCGHRNVMP